MQVVRYPHHPRNELPEKDKKLWKCTIIFPASGGISMYDPKPIDTSDVVLPEELLALTERIAENTHDIWAAGRIAEGWTYGDVKDSVKKTTPLLVPYSELPESEKAYDRNTSLETIKLIVKMGYRIERD